MLSVAILLAAASVATAAPPGAPVSSAPTSPPSGDTPATHEVSWPGLALDLAPALATDEVGAPPGGLAAFSYDAAKSPKGDPAEGRVEVWHVDRALPAPTADFLAAWLDAKRPGDAIAGGIVVKDGVLRAHTAQGKGVLLAATARGAYVVVVSPGRLLDDAIRAARVTLPPLPAPTRAATKTGLLVRVPPGFLIAGPSDAPPWAEVALALPSLAAAPPVLWMHTARAVATPFETPEGKSAAMAELRAELAHAGLGAAVDGVAATAPDAGRLETIAARPFVTWRAETLNWDLLAAYGVPNGAGLVAALRAPKGSLPRYESALRGVLGSIALAAPGAAASAAPGESVATAAPGAGAAHSDAAAGPAPMSAQRAVVALVLFLGLSGAALLAWRRLRAAGAGAKRP